MTQHTFKPKGVCPKRIDFDLEENVVTNIHFTGGCDGNLKAISRLLEGQTVNEISMQLEGNTCGRKSTSCADQLVCALKAAVSEA